MSFVDSRHCLAGLLSMVTCQIIRLLRVFGQVIPFDRFLNHVLPFFPLAKSSSDKLKSFTLAESLTWPPAYLSINPTLQQTLVSIYPTIAKEGPMRTD